MSDPKLSHEALVGDLRALGLEKGSRVVVHSSMRSIGWVPGCAEQVVDCLLEAIGDSGLLVAPTFTYTSTRFDPVATPGRTGAVSEALRRHPDAARSLHPFYSMAAVGPDADVLLSGHEELPGTAVGSPLNRLAESGGFVLLLGVGHVANTTIHVGEFRAGAGYLDIPFDPSWPSAAAIAIGGTQPRRVAYERFPGCSRAFGAVEGALRAAGTVRDGRIGRANSQLVPGSAVIEATVATLEDDPAGLLCTDPRCYRCPRAREAQEGRSRPRSGRGSRSMIASIWSSGTGGSDVPAIGSLTERSPAAVSVGVAMG